MPSNPSLSDTIQEVQGVFPNDRALQDAIGRLTRTGFDRAALSLPAANPAHADATPSHGAENPNTEDDMRQSRTLQSSMAARRWCDGRCGRDDRDRRCRCAGGGSSFGVGGRGAVARYRRRIWRSMPRSRRTATRRRPPENWCCRWPHRGLRRSPRPAQPCRIRAPYG